MWVSLIKTYDKVIDFNEDDVNLDHDDQRPDKDNNYEILFILIYTLDSVTTKGRTDFLTEW